MPTILVTGSTGFVGAELVARLLTRSTSTVVAPVRAASDAAARARGVAALEDVLARRLTVDETQRVSWVAGDLEKPRLGWDNATWRGWAGRVHEVYHCAASTQFDLPLDTAHRINVGGLRQVHAFAVVAAALGDFRRLHHVSTAYAAGRATTDIRAGALPPDEARYFRNTYERTKARAERFLRDYAEVPWTVYRPSIIVGDSRSGRTRSWNVCYAPMRLIAAGRLRMVPASSRAVLDYVPVDYVVDGILALGQRCDTEGRTLHLTAGVQGCSVPECLRLIDDGVARHKGTTPVATAVIGPRRFEAVVRSLQLLRPRTAETLARFRLFAPYTQVETRFENGEEAAMLRDAGIAQPVYADYFPRIVRYALEHDFGKPARRPARAPGPKRSQLGYQLGTLTFVRPANMARFVPMLPEMDVRLSGRAALMTAASMAGAPLALAESVAFRRKLRDASVQPPIFIVGHWRSGTTHLHNLLCQDPAFGYLTMYQAMAPDCSLVGGAWLRQLLSRVMPAHRPMDDMAWPLDAPQEEEIALGKVLPWSFYNQFLFPRRARELFDKYVLFRGAGPDDIENWKRQYLRILKVASLHAGGRRLVLKNPVNTARIGLLFDMFPTAQFIHIHRDPYEVFSSTRNLHRKVLAFSALQRVSHAEIDETVLHLYQAMMRRYFAERGRIPRRQLIDVPYGELARRPLDVMEKIYAQLGCDGFEQARPRVEAYLRSLDGYQKNRFPALTSGETARIESDWDFAFAELGYETLTSREERNDVRSA